MHLDVMPLFLKHPELLSLNPLPVELVLFLFHLIVKVGLQAERLKLSMRLHLLPPLLHVHCISILRLLMKQESLKHLLVLL